MLRALAIAYAKGGHHLKAWRQWCLLARQGDPEALQQLEQAPEGLRRSPGLSQRREFASRVDPIEGGVGTEALVVRVNQELLCLDSEDLSERWRQVVPAGAAGRCGPYVVHLGSAEPPMLVVREATTGQAVAEMSLGDQEAPVAYVRSDVGHAAVWIRPHLPGWHEWVLVLDLTSTPPTVISRLDTAKVGVDAELVCASSLLCDDQRTDDRGVVALAYGDGSERWKSEGGVVAGDARGAILVSWEDDPDEPSKEIWEVDPGSGQTRWRRESGVNKRPGPLLLTPNLLVHATHREPWHATCPGDDEFMVSAFDRASGALRWQYQEHMGRHATLGSAVAKDVAYIAVCGVERSPEAPPKLLQCRLLALDLLSGDLLFECPLEVPPRGRFGPRVSLFPLPEALAVLVSSDGSARLDLLRARE